MVSCCLCSCHSSKKSLFCFYQQYKSSESSEPKLKSRQASNHYKSVFEAAKLAYYNGNKGSITLHKIGSRDSAFNKSKSPVHSVDTFNDLWILSSASDKEKLFGKKSFKNANLDALDVSIPVSLL